MTAILNWLDRAQQRWPLLAVVIATFKRFGEHNGSRLTATITYWSFFSIFPLLLVFVTVLNIVLHDRPETRADLVEGALGQIPVIGTSLADNQTVLGGSWITVAVGVVTALWSGLAAANALQGALDEIWDVPRTDRPNAAMQRVRSVGFLVALALALSVSTLATNVDSFIDSAVVVRVLGVMLSFGANAAVVTFAFRLLPSGDHGQRRRLPGVLVAAGGVTVLQLVGSYIVTRYLSGASDTYGTFATVIALLSWLFLLARVTLMGAELNAVLTHRLWPRTLNAQAGPTDGDLRSVEYDERRIHRDDRFDTVVALADDLDAAPDDDAVPDDDAAAATPPARPSGPRSRRR